MTTPGNASKAVVAAMLVLPFLLAGCDAAAGAGRDISSAGHALTQSANQNRGY